jgi:hypothetical protein
LAGEDQPDRDGNQEQAPERDEVGRIHGDDG